MHATQAQVRRWIAIAVVVLLVPATLLSLPNAGVLTGFTVGAWAQEPLFAVVMLLLGAAAAWVAR